MTTNIANQSAFLRTSRDFPEDPKLLSQELTKSYLDIASTVNDRTIGIFPTNRSAQNGESWYLAGNVKQQAFRQTYTFTSAGSIAHGLNISKISYFTRIWGTISNGSNWYTLPYVDTTNANNQVSVSVTSSSIVITAGGGSPPSITKGVVVLEWIV